jgi:hypothetical protein
VSLAAAIARAEAELADFAPGTPQAPAEGSPDWYTLRARALALSTLRRAAQLSVTDPEGFERFIRAAAGAVKVTLPEEVA